MAYNSAKPTLLFDGHSYQQSRAPQADNCPPANHNVLIFAIERREKPGMGGSRPNVKVSDDCDPYGIYIAPLNMFEDQVLPVGVHNLST